MEMERGDNENLQSNDNGDPKKGVSVRAENKQEAEQRALDAWRNTEIILEPEDFDGVTVIAEDDSSEDNGSMPHDTVIGGF